MKKAVRLSALLLLTALALSALVACGGGGVTDDWTPSGVDVTLMSKTQPTTYTVIFGEPADIARAGANIFKDSVSERKLGVINSLFSSSMINEANEIIFGSSDRTASVKAAELLAKETAGSYRWAFYYYDGKLAVVANDEISYELAVLDLFTRFTSGESLVIKDTLAECKTMSEAEYDAYLDEKDLAKAEEKRKEHEKIIGKLLDKVEDQRENLVENNLFNILTATKDMTAIATGSNWGTAPYNPIDEHPRVMFTKDDIPGIRKALREDTATNAHFFKLLEEDYLGVLAPAPAYVSGQNTHNYNTDGLERIMVKALAYQLYGDPYYGYQAIYAMKNYLDTLELIYISGDQYRQFGDIGFTVACVYDWCYDLLTDEDKDQIIAGTENIIFKGSNKKGVKFEIGFPPTEQGSFTGHGSEYQLLRDYLSFSIAIYDENPTWYQLIGARFYNDYVPSRNYYFETTGVASQGTNYLALRHIATLYSAWLATAGMGANPYNNLLQTMYSFAAYEYAPGYIFTDGDGPTEQKTSNLRDAEFLAAYLYGDSTLLSLAEITLGEGKIIHATQGLGCAMYTIIRGKGTEPVESPHSNLDLIQYNGAPLGQYIVREAWNTTDSAAVFMKLKERHTANHEHGDSGSFQIYYKGMLSSEGGAYDNYNHEHTQKFYKTSVSHNTLLIKNHKVNDIYNVGAQRTYTEAKTLEIWLKNDYEAGTITGREHAYTDASETAPHYVYLAGEITKSYASDTVNYVGRRMLTVYTGDDNFPMAFFVYDDISTKNTAFKKTFLLQITSPNEPTISTKKQTVTTENGDGRLVLTCLTKGVSIEGLGGRVYDAKGNYDPINSKNYLVNGKQLVSLNQKDDGHWGRVEISIDGKTDHTLMNVMYVTDKGQKKDAPEIKHILDDGVEGSTFGDVAAIFMTSRERVTGKVSFEVDGKGEMKYYVSGVAEGKWQVEVDGKTVGSFEATADGGLLVFSAPAGDVVLTKKN